MGASASCAVELDEHKARSLVGAGWNEEIEARWKALCGEGSTASMSAAAAVAEELGLDLLDVGEMTEAIKGVKSAHIDMEDVGVRAMVKLSAKSTKMGHLQHLFGDLNNPEVLEERRLRVRKAAQEAIAEMEYELECEREATDSVAELVATRVAQERRVREGPRDATATPLRYVPS